MSYLMEAMYSYYFMFWAFIDESTIMCGCKSHLMPFCYLLGVFLME